MGNPDPTIRFFSHHAKQNTCITREEGGEGRGEAQVRELGRGKAWMKMKAEEEG